ncbi:hypothetical protein EYF80_012882 [Liparis tanakae]|uniref:Uncharacterized protein n=1 Tax=Liparis tanakae TaxID=230148 RepID=A0A4Z2IFK0_9TELE|nr:hypothetical protein EYF80_012882 [Liparis tanakae]
MPSMSSSSISPVLEVEKMKDTSITSTTSTKEVGDAKSQRLIMFGPNGEDGMWRIKANKL